MDLLVQERAWMYNQRDPGSRFNRPAFIRGVRHFMATAVSRGQICQDGTLRCPCSRCRNSCKSFLEEATVEAHLFRYGFVKDYYNWTLHGEDISELTCNNDHSQTEASTSPEYNHIPYCEDNRTVVDNSRLAEMVNAVVGTSHQMGSPLHESPNEIARKFYDLLSSSEEPVYDGCTTETTLSVVVKLLRIKADHCVPDAAYDAVCDLIKSILDRDNKIPMTFQHSKKYLGGLDMELIRIDVCIHGCMIFYKEDENLQMCRICGEPRFEELPTHRPTSSRYTPIARSQMFYLPIIPRLQRLFMTESTAAHMSWHANRCRDDSKMVHPSDGESWKHFDNCYPDFANESRNVRLGLCADGFTPFGMSVKSYSCWPVMLTLYNLPPWMCMKPRFMWLTILIPGPDNPTKQLDIYLKPLIDDLQILWNAAGVDTYDISNKKHFRMRAALLWTVSDFPAYAMLSGWSTHGRLACPYCMEDTKAFRLKNGRKPSHFDCHRRFLPTGHPYRDNTTNFRKDCTEHAEPVPFRTGSDVFERVRFLKYSWQQNRKEKLPGFGERHNWVKKSIFWDLPYWINVKLRHNIDVMHTEKNIFENLFNTIMDVKGKSKDNGLNCRKDIAKYCKRSTLRIIEPDVPGGKSMSKSALYSLSKPQQLRVYQWIKGLKFPDGYSSRLRNNVDLKQRKLSGYKSHDAHVFLERLMPVAFKGHLKPTSLWTAVSELCTFFRDICASSLDTERMLHWKTSIVETICKLEMFLPPSFFDSMEHLPIHLAQETLLGGPVQYRWMYPFERFIYRLKKMAKNKSAVEASIVNGYLLQEVFFFATDYLGLEFKTNSRKMKRNEIDPTYMENDPISIYNYPGRRGAKCGQRYLTHVEFRKATYYILKQTPEVEPYFLLCDREAQGRGHHHNPSRSELDLLAEDGFSAWLKEKCSGSRSSVPYWLRDLCDGFCWRVALSGTYKVNNYDFHTENHSEGRSTTNCHVLCKVTEGCSFYGVIEEIFEMQCRTNEHIRCVLFKCRWFDPSFVVSNSSTGIVTVNKSKLYEPYDPFILAQQAEQVYYTNFPGDDTQNIVAACRVKPTNTYEITYVDHPFQEDGGQNSEMPIIDVLPTYEGTLAGDDFVEYISDDEETNLPSDEECSSSDNEAESEYEASDDESQ